MTIDFGGRILAPMVRVSTLPTRLMALEYGADWVYTEECIDKGIIGCTRRERNGVIEYINADRRVVFQTCAREKDRVIFQIGSADPAKALLAAQTVEGDVAGIDLNCGCPKPFSTHQGIGAALLKAPDLLVSILEHLVGNLSIPVSCKIRIDKDLEKTIELMQRIERTGVCCIAVHCRTPSQRPRERGDQTVFKRLANSVSIPVIANGDIFKHGNIDQIMTETNVRGVMLARAAMWNVSIFCTEGPLPVEQVMRRYLELAIDLASPFKHVKYIFMQMVGSHEVGIGKAIRHARTYKEICAAFDMTAHLEARHAEMMQDDEMQEHLEYIQ